MNQAVEHAVSAIDLMVLLVLARVSPTSEVEFLLQTMGLGSAIGLLAASLLDMRTRPCWLPPR